MIPKSSLSSFCLLWWEISCQKVFLILILMTMFMTTPGDCQSPLPYFISHPSPAAVKSSGDSHTVPCQLSSTVYDSAINIVWLLNNMPIVNQTYNQTGNNLAIDSFTEDNNGNYTCVAATTDWAIRSNTALVQLVYLTSPFDGGSENVTAKRYGPFILDCMPGYSAYPEDQLKFEWFFLNDGQPEVAGNSNNQNRASEQLYVRRFIEETTFECKISSLLDTSLSVSYRTSMNFDGAIDANAGGEIFVKPRDVVANVGDSAAFYCLSSIGGGGSLNIMWSSSVKSISSSYFEYSISDVTKDDEGTYSCNIMGESESFSGTLTVRDPPQFTSSIQSISNVTYGESLSITCPGVGDDVQLLWYHNGVAISSNSTVYIDNADLSDSGAYQCFVISPSPSLTISNSTLVNVITILPSFLSNGTLYDQVSFTGSSLSLSCEAIGAPEPSYYWLKDGNDPAVLNLDTSVPGLLSISSITSLHDGIYTCVAETKLNGVIIKSINTSALVTVIEPTIIIYNNPANISSFIGDPFHLTCSVSHNTEKTSVQLSWTLNGQIITTGTVGKTSLVLNITNASSFDEGEYRCMATATYIQDPSLPVPITLSPITVVRISDMPVKPVVTFVTAVSSTTLRVGWTYKGFTDNLQEYLLEVQEDGNDRWDRHGTVLKSSVTVSNITGLKPYTQYNVRVSTVLMYSNGINVPSEAYGPIRTLQDIPSAPPPASRIDVATTNYTARTLTLQWEAPDPSTVNGIVTDYTIRYWLNGTVNITVMEALVGSNATKYTLTQLVPDAVYWVRIAAHTAIGRGPFSEPVKLSTDPTIGTISNDSDPIYTKIWFILICTIVGILMVVTLAVLIGMVRWRSKNKRNMYTVRHVTRSEEVSLTEDVVADYNRKRDKPMDFTESFDGSRVNIHDNQIDYPSFGRADSFRSSTRGSFRGSYRMGLHGPPEYINPPSFEETLKARLAKRRSASTTLLEKVDHTNFRGSGWSVGHDPKSSTAFFIPQPEADVDSMIVKPSFSEPGEETSGESDTSTGFHSHSVTNVESFAQFV